jgi:hypothetical protein
VSRRILKWELRVPGVTTLDVPAGSDILSVAFQGEQLFVWTAQPTGRANRQWTFTVIETGSYEPVSGEHLATAHGPWRGQPYAAHVYLRTEELP